MPILSVAKIGPKGKLIAGMHILKRINVSKQ